MTALQCKHYKEELQRIADQAVDIAYCTLLQGVQHDTMYDQLEASMSVLNAENKQDREKKH